MSNKTILLVEDNTDDVELTLHSFRKHSMGNPVVVAHDGEEALDYLFCRGAYAERRPCAIPALVLLDLQLPGMDGLEVLRRIRNHEKTKRTPVVIVSNSDEQRDIAGSYNLGVNSYIRKPVNFKTFNDVVRLIGLYWLVVNTPARA